MRLWRKKHATKTCNSLPSFTRLDVGGIVCLSRRSKELAHIVLGTACQELCQAGSRRGRPGELFCVRCMSHLSFDSPLCVTARSAPFRRDLSQKHDMDGRDSNTKINQVVSQHPLHEFRKAAALESAGVGTCPARPIAAAQIRWQARQSQQRHESLKRQ